MAISLLQHWQYCPRQCGLIHLEQVFDDNVHTLRGQAVHARADQPGVETAKGVRVERALPLWNDALGLIGKADVVEFLAGGVPYPVEYKHGSRNKAADIAACDDIQLAAQALCLESMLEQPIAEGALFYGETRRRTDVAFDTELRQLTRETIDATRAMVASGTTPTAQYRPKLCDACSLIDLCQPRLLNRPHSVNAWLARQLREDPPQESRCESS